MFIHIRQKNITKKVEYSTAAGTYCTTHDVKLPFCIPDISISKIITHTFYVNNKEGDTGIGCDILIGQYLVVQLGKISDSKHNVIEWDSAVWPMK